MKKDLHDFPDGCRITVFENGEWILKTPDGTRENGQAETTEAALKEARKARLRWILKIWDHPGNINTQHKGAHFSPFSNGRRVRIIYLD